MTSREVVSSSTSRKRAAAGASVRRDRDPVDRARTSDRSRVRPTRRRSRDRRCHRSARRSAAPRRRAANIGSDTIIGSVARLSCISSLSSRNRLNRCSATTKVCGDRMHGIAIRDHRDIRVHGAKRHHRELLVRIGGNSIGSTCSGCGIGHDDRIERRRHERRHESPARSTGTSSGSSTTTIGGFGPVHARLGLDRWRWRGLHRTLRPPQLDFLWCDGDRRCGPDHGGGGRRHEAPPGHPETDGEQCPEISAQPAADDVRGGLHTHTDVRKSPRI